MLTAKMSLAQTCSLTVMCAELQHLSLTNTASPPRFPLPLSAVLSARRSWNPSRLVSVPGVSSVSHVSVRTMILHSRKSLWCQVSTVSSSILLRWDLTFPMMTDGWTGLKRVLLLRRTEQHLRILLLLSSWGTSGYLCGGIAALLRANS